MGFIPAAQKAVEEANSQRKEMQHFVEQLHSLGLVKLGSLCTDAEKADAVVQLKVFVRFCTSKNHPWLNDLISGVGTCAYDQHWFCNVLYMHLVQPESDAGKLVERFLPKDWRAVTGGEGSKALAKLLAKVTPVVHKNHEGGSPVKLPR